jgi:integrase/recombinase XerD
MAKIIPVFNRKKKLNKQGKGPVDIYFYSDGVKRYFHAGIYVTPDQWNPKKWIVNNDNAIKLNYIIAKKVRDLEDYYVNKLYTTGEFGSEDIKDFTFGGSKESFIVFLEQEIKSDNAVTVSTRKHRDMMLKRLKEMYPVIPFNRVNYDLIDRFNKHLTDKGFKLSTIRKYHNQLRKFTGLAEKKGKIKESPYKQFKVKRPPKGLRKCLWYQDLDALWKLEYPDDSHYELVRLKFLFSCYTGLRISDNDRLTWDHIRDGKIMLDMQKTARGVVVPLNVLGERATLIAEKAKNIYGIKTVFKKTTNQEVNRHLKKISIDANLPFALNFHVSRHTFCTLVAKETGSMFEVMRYAGIYRVDTAQIYVNLAKVFE